MFLLVKRKIKPNTNLHQSSTLKINTNKVLPNLGRPICYTHYYLSDIHYYHYQYSATLNIHIEGVQKQRILP